MLFISTVSAQNKSNNKKGGAGKGVNASDTKKDDIQGAATWIVEVFENGENKPGNVSRLKATKNFKIYRGENEIGIWRKIDDTKVVVNIQNTDFKIGLPCSKKTLFNCIVSPTSMGTKNKSFSISAYFVIDMSSRFSFTERNPSATARIP